MNLWNSPLWGILMWPFSLLYGCGESLRMMMYKRQILPSVRLPAKVISVGNITVGGTGKTPVVATLASLLVKKGCRVGILSRGYGRRGKETLVVSDGRNILQAPREAGDEPTLLARRLDGVPVVVGKNRAKAGQKAIDSFGCNVLILDDAFQHHRLKRDLDLVIIDSTNPWGNGRLIPAGPLREPLSRLSRVDAILFSRMDQGKHVPTVMTRVRRWSQAPMLTAIHRSVEWVSMSDGRKQPKYDLQGKSVLAFAGIGNPTSFRNTLKALGVEIREFVTFRDHHWYTDKDLSDIFSRADRLQTEAVVTTEKDSVRVSSIQEAWKIPMYFLRIECELKENSDTLESILKPVLRS
jgi:tetraacyldisaccharide 4'-kinase